LLKIAPPSPLVAAVKEQEPGFPMAAPFRRLVSSIARLPDEST
jgi:hypothetical protein